MKTNTIYGLTPIRIDGADAAEFLHGQFTSDVIGLASGHVGFSAWCDPKGRVITTFILARTDETFWLLLPVAQREIFVKRLKMYVLRADVNITDASSLSAATAMVSVPAGDTINLLPGLTTGPAPQALRHKRYTLITYPPDITNILSDKRGISILRRAYETYFIDLYDRALDTSFIRQGIPWLQAETSGQFLPQELNLGALNALSLDKGCYPGQEIIARLRYRGKVKRDLCHATTENPTRLEPGAALQPEGEERNIGTVINSAITNEGQELLAVLERPFIETGEVVAEDVPTLSVKSIKETIGIG